MKKLLLTGFLPFLGESINPSQQLIESLTLDDQAWVDTLLLPVSFKAAPETLFQHLSQKNYKSVVMLGQAGGRSCISLEKVALNWVETNHPDENGYTPKMWLIDPTADKAFFSEWPLQELEKNLKAKNIPVEISFSAGTFVCNYLYFRTAAELALMKRSCLLIHFPYLPEQTVNKKGTPSMEFSVMQKGLQEILQFLKLNS